MRKKFLINQAQKLILLCGAAFIINSAQVFAQAARQLVYDGREMETISPQSTRREQQFVESEVKKKKAQIKQRSKLNCDEDTFGIIGTAIGAFTQPKSNQKAILYELCRSGRSFGIGGIIIIEKEKVVSHHIYGENGLNSGMKALPDINQNGLTELLLSSSGTGQGYTMSVIEIVEFENGRIKNFGLSDVYEDNYGTEDASLEATAYKIMVQPSIKPVFFRETYHQPGSEEKWKLIKKAQRISLKKDVLPVYHKIN